MFTINIKRNFNKPAFTSVSYAAEIFETLGIGQSVRDVFAIDTDIAVSSLFLSFINPFNPTDHFSSIQIYEWKSPIKLLSVERVKVTNMY